MAAGSSCLGAFSISNKNSRGIEPELREFEADELSNRSNSMEKNKKSRKRNADTFADDDTKERKSMKDIKPPKLEPDNSDTDDLSNDDTKERKRMKDIKPPKLEPDDSDSDDSSDDDTYDLKFNPETYDCKSTAFMGHICEEVINDKVRFKPEPEKIKGISFVIPDLTNVYPSCCINSIPERKSFSYNMKSFEWENPVEHEFVSKIDDNIRRTVDSILVPEDEYEAIRDEIIADLCDLFSEEKPKIRWHCFGSYSYGIVNSRISIQVHFEGLLSQDVRQDLCNKLKTSSCFHEPLINRIDPNLGKIWIRIRHVNTNKIIEISLSSALKVECSRMMKFYLRLNPNLKYLTVYLWHIMKKYRINSKRLGIYSFSCAFWLVVFFMQQENLLPAVIDVRKAAERKHFVSGWDCSLPEDYSYPTESVSLYSLLLGIFDFYKDFDFLHYVICPYLGRVITLNDIENLNLSTDEWSRYLWQIQTGGGNKIPFRRSFLNLQDPTDLSYNLDGRRFQCADLNMFIALCHRLSNSLPKKMAEFDKIDCVCQILLDSIDAVNYNPYDFSRYEKFFIFITNKNEVRRKKYNQSHFLEAIRKLMEFVYTLEPMSVVSQNLNHFKFNDKMERVIPGTYPVMHLEYCSSKNTWQNDYMKEIIPEKGPVRIYLRCEFGIRFRSSVHVYVQGEARLVGFLRHNFKKMLYPILNRI